MIYWIWQVQVHVTGWILDFCKGICFRIAGKIHSHFLLFTEITMKMKYFCPKSALILEKKKVYKQCLFGPKYSQSL